MTMNLREAGGGLICHQIEHRGSYSARNEANKTGETEERGHDGKLSGLCTAQSLVPFLRPDFSSVLPLPSMELEEESDFFFF